MVFLLLSVELSKKRFMLFVGQARAYAISGPGATHGHWPMTAQSLPILQTVTYGRVMEVPKQHVLDSKFAF